MVQASSLAFPILKNYKQSANSLFKSMRRLSSGERINRPGDSPSDFGISENLRRQIRNTDIATRNVSNMNDLIRSTDAWLQVGSDILNRMGELGVMAVDSAKTDEDRDKINLEFLQLKREISRLSRDAQYNSVQIAGRDQMLFYDLDRETFMFSQMDGNESYPLNLKVLSGVQTSNNQDFLFDSTKEFTLSGDGRTIFYADSNDNLTRYNIEEGTLQRDTADSNSKGLDIDEEGRLWYASETGSGTGIYNLKIQDQDTWSQDTVTLPNSSITDMAGPEFSVYKNRVYYRQTVSNDIVSRDVRNITDLQIELDSTQYPLTTTSGQFVIGEQGRYVADASSGTVRILNMESKQIDSFATGSTTISDLSISADGNLISYNDTTLKAIFTLEVDTVGESPKFQNLRKVHLASGTLGFRGISLDGDSHRGRFRTHNGPNALQTAFFQGADLRLHELGLSRTNVSSIDNAKEAIKLVAEAREIVNEQRSVLGAAESRFSFTYSSLIDYNNNISMADSRLRDVDMPHEITKMAEEQVRYQAVNSLIVQANQLTQAALRLLGG
jgi:flagellin